MYMYIHSIFWLKFPKFVLAGLAVRLGHFLVYDKLSIFCYMSKLDLKQGPSLKMNTMNTSLCT